MEFISKIWRGEASLGFTFWILGIFMLFILRLFEIATIKMSSGFGQVGFIVSISYFLVYSIILWRTAAHVEYDLVYARLVRGFIFLGWGRYIISANLLPGLA
jgi:hypothetical protein